MDGGAAAPGAAGPALPESAKPLGPPLPEGQLHGAALIEGLMNWTTQVCNADTVQQLDTLALLQMNVHLFEQTPWPQLSRVHCWLQVADMRKIFAAVGAAMPLAVVLQSGVLSTQHSWNYH